MILTDIIHANFGKKTSRALKMFGEQELEEAAIREHRLRSIFVVARGALATWWPLGTEPIPTWFNRHASLHRLTPAQYTEHHALVGLMLVVPLIREVDVLIGLTRARRERDLTT